MQSACGKEINASIQAGISDAQSDDDMNIPKLKAETALALQHTGKRPVTIIMLPGFDSVTSQ